MSLSKKKTLSIDPLMFDDRCLECGNPLPLEGEKLLSCKGFPDICVYITDAGVDIWRIREVVISWMN